MQGKTGVVAATGNGYWSWVNVLVTWSPSAVNGPAGGAPVAAIVVPVILAALLVCAAVLGALWWRRRRWVCHRGHHVTLADVSCCVASQHDW
jgi:uncharacterized iron-regulated membrane protein